MQTGHLDAPWGAAVARRHTSVTPAVADGQPSGGQPEVRGSAAGAGSGTAASVLFPSPSRPRGQILTGEGASHAQDRSGAATPRPSAIPPAASTGTGATSEPVAVPSPAADQRQSAAIRHRGRQLPTGGTAHGRECDRMPQPQWRGERRRQGHETHYGRAISALPCKRHRWSSEL
ncbi:hypothetical protein GCM10009753_01060 [Streptantibioticus ferralitis]